MNRHVRMLAHLLKGLIRKRTTSDESLQVKRAIFLISAILGVLAILVIVAAAGLGRQREAVKVAGKAEASEDYILGFHAALRVDETFHNTFDGQGRVRGAVLTPGGGVIGFGFCSPDLMDKIRSAWKSRVVAVDEAGVLAALKLEVGESLSIKGTNDATYLTRLFAGFGEHKISVYGMGGDPTAILERSVAAGTLHAYDLEARDYETELTLTIANSALPDVTAKTATIPEGGECGAVQVQTNCPKSHCTGPESISFHLEQETNAGVKGESDSLSAVGVTANLSAGDDLVSFTGPLSTLDISFSERAIFDVSFNSGTILFDGRADSIKFNGVEQLPTEWPGWAVLSGKLGQLVMTAALSAAVAAWVTNLINSRRSRGR